MLFKYLVTDFIYEHKWKFIMYLILIFAFFPIEAILIPKIYGKLFETIKSISKFSDIYNWRKNFTSMNFPGSMVLLIILWVLVLLAYSGKNQLEALLIPSYFSYSRDIIFKQTIKTYQNKYEDIKTGEYLSRVLELTRNFKDLFQHILSRFLPELIVSFLIAGYMFSQNTSIGLIMLTGMTLCLIIQYVGGKQLLNLVHDRESFFNTKLSENIRDCLDNLMNIFLNNEIKDELKKNDNIEEIAKSKLEWIMFMQNVVVFSTQFVTLITFALSIGYVYYLISKKEMKVTHGIVLIIILGQFINNFLYVNSGFVHHIIYKIGVISASNDYLENIFQPIDERDVTDGITNGDVVFKNVKFRYDKNKTDYLFTNLNLEFKSGESYALVGQSGGGKTTTMKMLVGLYEPDEGSILIDGIDVRTIDLEYLRNNVNYINQRTNLFNESIMYNMLYGNEDYTEEDVIQFLTKYDLLKMFDLPDGLNAIAGVQGGNMSGGMQRITVLVRGILKKSKIVVIDEPTTGLDLATSKKAAEMIFKETVGKTLILITHSELMRSSVSHVYDISDLK
jgi:ABC-type multidrug transport system fused ATPase/permease subunit